MVNKAAMSEIDICQNYITPAVERAGWSKLTQIRREVSLTPGPIRVRGTLAVRSTKHKKQADYVLFHRDNFPLAVIEAKKNSLSVGHGMQQALGYAEMLDVPFVFSSNGDGFLFHDKTGTSVSVERKLTLDQFPSPDELWEKYRQWKGLTPKAEQIVQQSYHDGDTKKSPRYYQRAAIQRVVEAVAADQKRMLLVMATGTGKTYTAFQTIWRLRQSGAVDRVLFLVDRSALAKQTATNDFAPLNVGEDTIVTRVTDRNFDPSYGVYIALYQAVTGSEEEMNVYKELSPDFFDLIIIDECHRGSARADSAWREVLDYFSSAIHLGLTATPKETKDVSTQSYFGEPLYTYSLKQGIQDGFLAPYKVVRIDLDKDLLGWRPTSGQLDDTGEIIEDRVYNQKDMDKSLVLDRRTECVAEQIVTYMKATDKFGKTIVFCQDIDHATRTRHALANEVERQFPDQADKTDKFVVRITGDSPMAQYHVDSFTHPEKRYPVIATTSKLLSTGIDSQTVKLIVLDQTINSMTEFKQTIGRGTRINEDYGKRWFTIMDFRKATELFADPAFDGEPVVVYDASLSDGPVSPETLEDPDVSAGLLDDIVGGSRPKYYVSGEPVEVLSKREQYLDASGKLITESMTDYTKKTVRSEYASLDVFLKRWTSAEKKAAIVEELEEQGVFLEELRDKVGPNGKDLDVFDLIVHVVYGQPPLTRRERADNVKKRDVFSQYGDGARAVLDALIDKYADEGIAPVENPKILQLAPFTELGTPVQLIRAFGGKDEYNRAVRELEDALYNDDSVA